MIEKFKTEKVFNSYAISMAAIFIIAGAVTGIKHPLAFILVAIGLFIAFSTSGTIIDYHKKQIKRATYIFGIIAVGKWIPIKNPVQIQVKKNRLTLRLYSRSNRQLDLKNCNYSVKIRFGEEIKSIIVENFVSLEDAKNFANNLQKKLNAL